MLSIKECPHCGGRYRNLGVHIRHRHTKESSPAAPVAVKVGGEEPSSASPFVKFMCPRAPQLSIIVKHGFRRVLQGAHGAVESVDDGKIAQFVDGVLVTDDPDIIHYLTTKYKDPKFPIVNATAIGLH